MHGGLDLGEIDVGEFLPLGGEDEGLGSGDGFERGLRELHAAGDELPLDGFFHALRVVGGDDGALGDEAVHEVDGERVADVVGVGLEGEAPDGDLLFLQDPEAVAEFLEEAFELGGVDALDFLEQGEWGAEFVGDGDEGLDVFREAGAAVAEAGIQEGAADAAVHADAVGDEFDVGAAGFADGAEGIDVADLEREEGIRGVFDEFGAVHVGDEDGGLERIIHAAHEVGSAVARCADDDAVGLHEVGHGAAFAEEFGI